MGALQAAGWLVTLGVGLGMVLACFALLERRLPGALRPAPVLHGLAGLTGFGLLVASGRVFGGGLTAGLLLAMALVGGGMVAAARWRGGRPAGLAVTLHAALGFGGWVLLVALIAVRG